MYYVIELTCIGPKILETFKSKELAAQYTIALHKNYPDKHYQIAKAELDMDGIEWTYLNGYSGESCTPCFFH